MQGGADPDMAAKMAAAFKIQANRLRKIVAAYLPPDLTLAITMMDAMPAEVMCTLFHARVCVPYVEHILSKDQAFFMDMDAKDVGLDGGADPILASLKSSWQQIKPAEQDSVWAILDIMCQVADRYFTTSGAAGAAEKR